MSSIKRDSTGIRHQACENFLYDFKAARRAARAAATAPWPSLPLPLPLRPGQRRAAGATAEDLGAAINRESFEAAAGFDKGTLAMTHIGLTGAGRSQPDPPTSVRAIAPCQIPSLRPPIALMPTALVRHSI